MEKKHPKYFLDKSPIRTRKTDVYKAPNCEGCDCVIAKGMRYVAQNAHNHYCLSCALKQSKSIRTCQKKLLYTKLYDALLRGRQKVKRMGIWQLPYKCPHCRKYHLTTVQKKSVPLQLRKIYEYDGDGHVLYQAMDKYILEND